MPLELEGESVSTEQHLNADEEKRLSSLFKRLDVNHDGRIDVHDLSKALQKLRIPHVPGQAQRFVERIRGDKEGHIDFGSFVQFVLSHEKRLKLSFAALDHNKDGVIDEHELVIAFRQLGVQVDNLEAKRLIKRISKDDTLPVTWETWRDFLWLHPSSDLTDIVHHWRHATMVDVGEDVLVTGSIGQVRPGDWWCHLVAGGVAGALSRTSTAPVDRLKVMLQAHASRSNNLGMLTGFRHMLDEGGVQSLWRGNGINVLKIMPEAAFKFTLYEQIKRHMKGSSNRDLYIWERFLAGSLAGALAQSSIYPLEVLKTRLALGFTGQYDGVVDCLRQMLRSGGWRTLYRGYVPNIIGIVPYAGIDLAVYESLKRFYLRESHERQASVLVLLACGTVSSTCGQLASYPFALVRTKLQAGITVNGNDSSMLVMFRTIVASEGVRGLYRGIIPNFMKVAPAVSISYVVYEKMSQLLGIRMS